MTEVDPVHRADASAAAVRGDRGRFNLTRTVTAAFAAMDLSFKVVVIPAYLDLMGERTAGGGSRLAVCLETTVVVVAGFLIATLLLSRGVEKWRAAEAKGDLPDGAIKDAVLTLRRFPRRMAMAWSAHWVLLFALLSWRGGGSSWNAIGFLLSAMAIGPLPLAHGLSAWLVSPVVRRVSLAARIRGVAIPSAGLTLGWQLAFHSLGLALAPALYMAAVAFAAREQMVPVAHLMTTVTLFFGAIVLFAVLTAALVAATITGPVGEMAEVMRIITRQGDVSRVGRVPLYQRDEVGKLAEITNEMIDRLEFTETARARAADALAALNHTLELRVEERTQELSTRNADMRLVLDNVEQGLFTIDRAGAMSVEHSAVLSAWFGAPEPGQPFYLYIGRKDPAFGKELELAWQQVVDDLLPVELALAQMPQVFACAGQHFRFAYAPIDDGGALRFLVVVSDATGKVEQERLQLERREILALFEHMLADRTGFIGFIEEASEIVSRIVTGRFDRPVELKRELHTLKGNAALFGLRSVADLCHELESRMAEEHAPPGAAALALLEERWSKLVEQVNRLLGERRLMIEMTPEQHGELERAIVAGATSDQLLRMVRELKLEPVERRLRHFADEAARIGRRLEKRVALQISHDGLRLDGRHWSRFWSAFVHAVRNAVDHGIEPPAERLAAAKPEEGRISLRAAREGTNVVIEIEDDGRGISWDRIRHRLAMQGGGTSRQSDLEAALFAGGVSTAAQVTALSGRGIGMSALQTAVQDLGGGLEIQSEAARGTRLRMTFPGSAVTPGS